MVRRFVLQPFVMVVVLFWVILWIGTGLLMTPWASTQGIWTPLIDALFTAASALFVTGLAIYDTGVYWSWFGQLVILCLIQIGALGVVMIGSYLSMIIGRKIYFQDRKILSDSLGSETASGTLRLLKRIIGYVLLLELIGSIVLGLLFMGHAQSFGQAMYWGVFHTISAFGNAGFDVLGFNSSLEQVASNGWIVLSTGILIMLGGVGFPVWVDLVGKLQGRSLSYHSVLVLRVNLILWLVGMGSFFVLEWGDRVSQVGLVQHAWESWFHSVSARTAGFSLFNLADLSKESIFVLILLMATGGSPVSTAGGIKVTTMAIIGVVAWSYAMGKNSVDLMKRRITSAIVTKSVSIAALFFVLVAGGLISLELIQDVQATQGLFEVVSALATVGLTLGLTTELSVSGKLVIVFLMFMGRVGLLSLMYGTAYARQHQRYQKRHAPAKILLS